MFFNVSASAEALTRKSTYLSDGDVYTYEFGGSRYLTRRSGSGIHVNREEAIRNGDFVEPANTNNPPNEGDIDLGVGKI